MAGYINEREQIVLTNTAIGLLERETMLAATVWRDAATDFSGKVDDTVSIRLPAYTTSNKRALRANEQRERRTLYERKVDVTIDTDHQIDVALTDEEQTLDVRALARDVMAPAVQGIVRGIDDDLGQLIQNAPYEVSVGWDGSNPYNTLVDARQVLNDFNVPTTERFLVVGSDLESQLLKHPLFVRADQSGSSATLRRGVLGTILSMTVLGSSALDPDFGALYHRTAFSLVSRAPVVPQGVAWGVSSSRDGFAIRIMQHLGQDSSKDLQNILYHDVWTGMGVTKDNGKISNGKFVPADTPGTNGNTDMLVRAVKLGGGVGSS